MSEPSAENVERARSLVADMVSDRGHGVDPLVHSIWDRPIAIALDAAEARGAARTYEEAAKIAEESFDHEPGCELYTVNACTCGPGEVAAGIVEAIRARGKAAADGAMEEP